MLGLLTVSEQKTPGRYVVHGLMETYAGLSQLYEEGQAGSPARRAAGVHPLMSLHLGVVERQWASEALGVWVQIQLASVSLHLLTCIRNYRPAGKSDWELNAAFPTWNEGPLWLLHRHRVENRSGLVLVLVPPCVEMGTVSDTEGPMD